MKVKMLGVNSAFAVGTYKDTMYNEKDTGIPTKASRIYIAE